MAINKFVLKNMELGAIVAERHLHHTLKMLLTVVVAGTLCVSKIFNELKRF